MGPPLACISVLSILLIISRILFLAFFKNFPECIRVISGVSTDESSYSHNQFANIFCMCLNGICGYPYQTNIRKLTA